MTLLDYPIYRDSLAGSHENNVTNLDILNGYF
jgi:hypothetical protein